MQPSGLKLRLIHWKEWVKTYLQRIPWFYQLVMRWKARRHPVLLVRKGFTQIVIEAYPRSSNSFAVRLFRHANPDIPADRISHHSHIVSNVRHAVGWGIPVLVIIREPVKTISSNMLAVQDTSDGRLEILTVKYLDFYTWVRNNAEKVVIARFEDIVEGRFRMISEALNNKFGVNFSVQFDEAEIARQARESIRKHSPNKSDPHRVPLPSEQRENAYTDLRPRLGASESIRKAVDLYNEILEYAVTPG